MAQKILKPFFFRNKGPNVVSKGKQRFTLGKREAVALSTDPMGVWWRRRIGNNLVTSIRVKRVGGDGVLPIRISRTESIREFVVEDLVVYYMDSGFLKFFDEFEDVITDSKIWQTTETQGFQAFYSDPLYVLLRPQIPVAAGNTPPSFDPELPNENGQDLVAQKSIIVEYNFRGNYTGKLAWLVGGKKGLRITNTRYFDALGSFLTNKVAKQRLSGEGIYTSETDYWYVVIGADGYSGTATKLVTPLWARVAEAILQGKTGSELDLLETYALAYSEMTSTVLNITFVGAAPVGLPLAYGWHFMRDGHRGVITTHNIEDDMYSARTYYMDLTISEDSALATVSKDSEKRWCPNGFAVFWTIKEVQSGSLGLCPLDPIEGAEAEANNVTTFTYYDSDDNLQEIKYSYTYEEAKRDHPCANNPGAFIDAMNAAIHTNVYWTAKTTNTVSGGGETIEAVWGDGMVGILGGSYTRIPDTKETVAGGDWSPATCGSDVLVDKYVRNTFCNTSDTTRYYKYYEVGPDCSVYQKHTLWNTFDSIDYLYFWGGYGEKRGSVGVVPLFDCADGLMVVKEEVWGGNATTYHGEDPTAVGVVRFAQYEYKVGLGMTWAGPCAESCSQAEDYFTVPKHWTGGNPPGAGPVSTQDEYRRTTKVAYFNKYDPVTKSEAAEVDSGTEFTAYVAWLNPFGDTKQCIAAQPYLIQGRTEPFKVFDGVEVYTENSFPEDAEVIVGWA